MILVNRAELKENVIQQVVGICHQHKANQTASPHLAKWWRGEAGTGDRHLKKANKQKGMEQVEVWQERGISGPQISIH